jgi:hypothetical protein
VRRTFARAVMPLVWSHLLVRGTLECSSSYYHIENDMRATHQCGVPRSRQDLVWESAQGLRCPWRGRAAASCSHAVARSRKTPARACEESVRFFEESGTELGAVLCQQRTFLASPLRHSLDSLPLLSSCRTVIADAKSPPRSLACDFVQAGHSASARRFRRERSNKGQPFPTVGCQHNASLRRR